MTAAVQLDADPPRLRRKDGLTVRFPPDAKGGFPIIEVGWLRDGEDFEPLLRWRGFTYQELQPGAGAALLVGHVPGGGYCSVAATLNKEGVKLEFADCVPADRAGVQTFAVEYDVRPAANVAFEAPAECLQEVEEADEGGFSRRRIELRCPVRPSAVATTLRVFVWG